MSVQIIEFIDIEYIIFNTYTCIIYPTIIPSMYIYIDIP
jgi:hypothetical protein